MERQMFATTIDAKEVDLINKVAAIIDPMAFDRSDWTSHRPPAEQIVFKETQDRNRERARDMAINILRVVRESN
jgi:hypothetical protein